MSANEFNVQATTPIRKYKASLMILANMSKMAKTGNKGGGGVLLAGDPGVGKTSFMRFFSQLVGMNLITIEAPHIVEEHIINIPFIVSNALTGAETNKSTKAETNDEYSIELADSALFSEIQQQKVIPDAAYIKKIYSDKDLTAVYEKLGGTSTNIPKSIAIARSQFSTILFLDEYWRQVSTKIRNMLRGILNGKIGLHDLPKSTYIAYASNLQDAGVETSKPSNSQFFELEFSAPDKDEWFTYLINKFEKDEHIKLNSKIIKKFYELLSDEELNAKDASNDIRTSPRRWEQLLLYINAAFPIQSNDEAELLITNVKLNFRDYDSGEHAELYKKVLTATKELIKEISGIDYHGEGKESHDWKDTLSHQIKMKMKLGEHRKYIPIISGLPGIGKTTHVEKAAADNDLRLIYIDCSTFDADDSTGIGLAERDKSTNKLKIKFSEPKLYKIIHDQIETQDKEHLTALKNEDTKEAKQKIKDYGKTRWKYLIFFDELNRTTPKVFNALRRVILEKKFSDSKKLPDESIIVAAINPDDVGAAKLTAHMTDVTDILPTSPDWISTKKYLSHVIETIDLDNKEVGNIVFDFILAFSENFKTHDKSHPLNTRQFYLDMGSENIYISPREYTDILIKAASLLDISIDLYMSSMNDVPPENLAAHIDAINKEIRNDLYDVLKAGLRWVLEKHNNPHGVSFLHDLKTWVLTTKEFQTDLFNKKADVLGIKQILDVYFDNDTVDIDNEIEFINYINNTDPQKFRSDLLEYYQSKIDTPNEFIKYVIEEKRDISKLDAGIADKVKSKRLSRNPNATSDVNHIIYFTFELVYTLASKNVQNEFFEALFRIIGTDLYSSSALIAKQCEKYSTELVDAGYNVSNVKAANTQTAISVITLIKTYAKQIKGS